MKPSEIQLPLFYDNDDPTNGAGMSQSDYGDSNLLSIAEMLDHWTFQHVLPEFQRRLIAMFSAIQVEVGMKLGVGTAWRSEEIQAANHAKWPNQFSPVESSYHMRVPPSNKTLACDTVPGDAWKWMHANDSRFGIRNLTANEQHHVWPYEIPGSRTTYNRNPEFFFNKIQKFNLPYMGMMDLDDWLKQDNPIGEKPTGPAKPAPTPTPEPQPTPAPTPTTPPPEVALMSTFNILAKASESKGDVGKGSWWAGNGAVRIHVAGDDFARNVIAAGDCVDAKSGQVVTSWDGVGAIKVADIERLLGTWNG